MPRVAFHTLGCKLNFAETSTIARDFKSHGFDVVELDERPDVAVINTCSVTEEAERKCRQVIRRTLRSHPSTFVVVTGCYAQLRPDDLARIPGVDAVLGAAEKFQLFSLIDSFSKAERTQVAVSCIDDVTSFGAAYSSGERTRAFLKVQDGCDYRCSFCTIPAARGRSRSASIETLVEQAHDLAEKGFSEVVLSGVNIGLFGQDRDTSLLPLLRALDEVEGIARYRISSIEPNLLTDEIIDFVAQSRAFQPHFHIPLQSGDDEVLGAMRRRYRRNVYEARVRAILDRLPHAGIGADVIVGFPAETQERFENTCAFIEGLPITYLHVFTYSERPGTVAVDQLDHEGGSAVHPSERSRRNRALRLMSAQKHRAFVRRHLGTARPVVWEHTTRDGHRFGYTDNYIRVQQPTTSSFPETVCMERLERLEPDGTVSVA